MKQAFVIAAPSSGSGKTTVARGLMALLREKGCGVQPFKCGPDYIDTKFHEHVCGRPSVNLDTFMASAEHVRQLFARYGQGADVCVVEGMMGLFDGYDRDRGSTAEVARVLGLPVVLVVDAQRAAYSMAALLQGFAGFRDDVHIAGVIFNKVGSGRHSAMLRQVCDDLHLPCLGCLPKHAALEQGSRYLGLDFSGQMETHDLTRLLSQHVDWQQLLSLRCPATACKAVEKLPLRVLVARNAESFSFLYQETIDCFQTVQFFNPETEVPALDGTDLLYLPGGYPEKHLHALAANEACRRAIKDYADGGGRIVAECGGMMYLCRSIVGDDGQWAMCGVLPYDITARKADRRLSLGYRQLSLAGCRLRGHEFHYSQFLASQGEGQGCLPPSAATVCDARGNEVAAPVIRQGGVLASYVHLYWGEGDIETIIKAL